MTNADKIRNMSDEELAETLIDRIDIYCKDEGEMWIGDFWGIRHIKDSALKAELEWLQQEVKE